MIIYTVIARIRDAAVLVEDTSPDIVGNAPQVTTMLLNHIKNHPNLLPDGERRTFIQTNRGEQDTRDGFFSSFLESCATALSGDESWVDENYFHLLRNDGVIYLCISDDRDIRDQKV